MRSLPHDPLALPVKFLAWTGLAGLAALTLVDRGATRMFATPWNWVLITTLAGPVAVLVGRALSPARPLFLPSPVWLLFAGLVPAIAVLSALTSPYRGMSLLSAALPVSATAAFLMIHDWLATDGENQRDRLARFLAVGAALVTAASTLLWLADALPGGRIFSASVFQMRNPHPLGHSNYTAGLMLLGLPWLARAARRATGATRIGASALTALAFFNLFSSGSRGGVLGLAALGVAAVAAARPGWKKFLLIGAGAVILAAILAVANPRIRDLLQSADPAAQPSLSNVQRSAMMKAGWLMGRDHPWLGWGPGTTPLAYPRYRHALAGGTENVLQLHSIVPQLWAETGAAGLLAGAAFGLLVMVSWRRSPAAAATLAGYGVFSLTDYQFDVPVFAAAGAALLALLAQPAPTAATRRARWIVSGAALVCAVAILFFGQRDPAPRLNVAALTLARDQAQHDRAVALLRESLALNPEQEIAHFNLGWLLVVTDPAAAEKHFLAAAHLVPDKGGVYFGLGLAHLNQGRSADAARALALECLNEPLFLATPWWTIPELAALRDATAAEFGRIARPAELNRPVSWTEKQMTLLHTLAPRLGQVSPGPEINYRRERIGYPVLMRDLDLPVPVDLYDVREDPRFPASVPFPLPSKGWLPSDRLLSLLDAR